MATRISDDRPATLDDVEELRSDLNAFEQEVASRFDQVDRHFDELKQHFNVVAEQIRHDALGANRDQIEVLKDNMGDCQRRITRIEQRLGIVTV